MKAMIKEFLESKKIDKASGPSDWHFKQVDKIVAAYNVNQICHAIMDSYAPHVHDPHQVANLFNMIIWHSTEYDLEVSRYFKNWDLSGNEKLVGVCISKELEWFPFRTASGTLKGVKSIKNQYPQFIEDCNYWEKLAAKEIKN